MTGIERCRLIGALTILTSLGDHAGVAVFPPSPGANRPRYAVITQITLSDLVTLAHDPAIARRMGRISPMAWTRREYTPIATSAVYRVTVAGGGGGYAAIIAGDGVPRHG